MTPTADTARVLYVDGDSDRRNRFRVRFEADDGERTLRTADTVESALALLATEEPPRCLVTVPALPDGDGLELLGDVRRRWGAVPAVLAVVEGSGSDELARDAVDVGVDAYLPVRTDEEVATLVGRAVALARTARPPSSRAGVESFLQDAVDALDDVFYVFDVDFRLVRWNRRLNDLFGLTDEELVGKRPTEFFLEADRPAVERAAATAMRDGEGTVEARGETREGVVRFELTGRRLTAPDGSLVGLCGVGRDITDRRRRERQLRQQNERLAEFADVLTHDLRNPLAVSTGFLALERESNDSPNLARVADSLARMSDIVDDVLTAARRGLVVEDPSPVAVADVARAAWETVETGSGTVAVETDQTVLAEEEYLRRLFENLFRNSVEHGPSGVAVTVGALPDGFYVADDGPGVSDAVRETLFDSGVSTNAEGTGFGLHIVRSLAAAHGWDVALAADDGNGPGARFEFRGVSVVPDTDCSGRSEA